jgi:NADH-quinone oxidoreductase subunit A
MLTDVIYLVAFSFAMLAFPLMFITASKIVSKRRPTPRKVSTYECGEVPVGEGRSQLIIQYWSYAIIFIIFDVFAVFLLLILSRALLMRAGGALLPLIMVGMFTLSLVYSWRALIEGGV